MKKLLSLIIILLLVFLFLTCGEGEKRETTPNQAEEQEELEQEGSFGITLNQELLDRYIKTLPPFTKRAKKLGKDVDSVGAAWLAGSEIAAFLNQYGWNNPEEFSLVHVKIWSLAPWLIMSGQEEEQSAEMQEMMALQFDEIFKESGVTEEEKQLLIDNQGKLFAAFEAAE